jgi:hypothetical protein
MSPAEKLVEKLRPLGREGAMRAIRAAWDQLTPLEQSALATDATFWPVEPPSDSLSSNLHPPKVKP